MFSDKNYIGSAARHMSCQVAENMGVSVRTGLPLSCQLHSFIFQHESDIGHTVQKFNLLLISYSNPLYALWRHVRGS